jgi:hypothetical protein
VTCLPQKAHLLKIAPPLSDPNHNKALKKRVLKHIWKKVNRITEKRKTDIFTLLSQ